MAVSLESVTKVYPNGVVALDEVTLTIADNEFAVIVGPSGCGKTTALRVIAGLEEATRGNVRIGGRVANRVPPAERDVAMVFQSYALYPHMSVYENIEFSLRMRRRRLGLSRDEMRARAREAATVLGLGELLGRRPRELSGGQRQRVALARAMARQPRVFLFDEPLSNLDARTRWETRRELKELHRTLSVTTVYVTHDQLEAMTLGDRIAVMDHGSVQQIGTPADVHDRPANRFVAGFVGTLPMNFIAGRVTADAAGERFVADAISLPLPRARFERSERADPDEWTLGIRPEAIELEPAAERTELARLRGRVSAVEPMGSEVVLGVTVGRQTVSCRSARGDRVERNQWVELGFDMSRSHLFDKRGASAARPLVWNGGPDG